MVWTQKQRIATTLTLDCTAALRHTSPDLLDHLIHQLLAQPRVETGCGAPQSCLLVYKPDPLRNSYSYMCMYIYIERERDHVDNSI